jgi:hypothetical protein
MKFNLSRFRVTYSCMTDFGSQKPESSDWNTTENDLITFTPFEGKSSSFLKYHCVKNLVSSTDARGVKTMRQR